MRCRPIKYLELTVSARFTWGQITLFDWTLKIKLNNRRYLRYLIGYQICIFTLGGYVRPGGGKSTICAQVKIREHQEHTKQASAVITMGAGKSLLFSKKQLDNFSKWLDEDYKQQDIMFIRIPGRKKHLAYALVRDGVDCGRLDLHIFVRWHLVEKPDGWGGITYSYFLMFQKHFRNSTD